METNFGSISEGKITANHSPKPVRVWLVDDNDTLRELVAKVLTGIGGIDCARHFSSPDALLSTLASKPGPDVILLDVQMGRHNGLDAVRPIKSLTRSTRVLMFTSSNDWAWRKRAMNDGASDYLLKSAPIEWVAERIRTIVEQPAVPARPRASCLPPTCRPVGSAAEPAPRLLSRTLKKLGLVAN